MGTLGHVLASLEGLRGEGTLDSEVSHVCVTDAQEKCGHQGPGELPWLAVLQVCCHTLLL